MTTGRRRDTEDVLLEQVERLTLSASRIDEAIEMLSLPAFFHDGAEIVAANTACIGWLGYAHRRDLVGRGLGALTHGEDQVSLLAAVGATSRGPMSGAHLQRFRFRHGRVALGEVLARRLPGRAPPLTAVVVQPMTASHRSPDHLRLLEAAVDHLKDIVFITEADSIDALGRRVVMVNQAFSRVTGFEPSEVLGKTPNVTVGEATDRAALARIEQRLKKRLPVREEIQKFGKDGKGYWVELDIIPVFDDDGRHTHWVSVQRDITERKQLRDELAGAERLARRLAGEVEDPLATTLDNLEVIAQQLLAPTADPSDQANVAAQLSIVRQGLERARLSAQRARGILRQLAVLAEGSSDRRTDVDLRLLVNGAFDDVAREVPIHGDVLRSYESLPPVLAYREQLSQLLYGLILEAAVALDPRYTSTNALFLRISAAGDDVVVEVEATGPGAAAPQRSNPGAPGAELGLLVARSLTRSIGAELYHHPSPGTGTRYRVRLTRSARSPARHESSERISPRFQSARVLVVEPDARHALELRRLLAAVNHVVVETGFEGAAHRLRSDPQVDVVFCDLSSLGASASELYQLAGDLSAKLPGTFVFTRSAGLPRRLEAFLEATGRPQVEKPFDVDEVRSALSAVLYADLRSGGG